MLKVLATAVILSASLMGCAPVDKGPTILDPNGPNQCRAQDWQSYVGKPRQSLPEAPQGMRFRVLCSTCAATMDYISSRVTFTYDDNGIITRASCG